MAGTSAPSIATAILALALGVAVAGCAEQPSQAEFDAALAQFDALPDEAKAYACADDWYAVQQGVEGFVIVERCGRGSEEPATTTRPLSSDFERADLAYTEQYYRENPPDSGLLSGVDVDQLCAQSETEIRTGIEQWREQTQFPTWDGVEFVPSTEHETAKLLVWQETACPLVESRIG